MTSLRFQEDILEAITLLKQKTNENETCLKDIYPKLLIMQSDIYQAEKRNQELVHKMNEIQTKLKIGKPETKEELWQQQLDNCTKELHFYKEHIWQHRELLLNLESKYFTDYNILKDKIEEQNNKINENEREWDCKFDEIQRQLSNKLTDLREQISEKECKWKEFQKEIIQGQLPEKLSDIQEQLSEKQYKFKDFEKEILGKFNKLEIQVNKKHNIFLQTQEDNVKRLKHYISEQESKIDTLQREIYAKITKLEQGHLQQLDEINILKSQIMDHFDQLQQSSQTFHKFDKQLEKTVKATDKEDQIRYLKSEIDNQKISLQHQNRMFLNEINYSKLQIFKLVNEVKKPKSSIPLHLACEYGLTDVVIKLIKEKDSINTINMNYMSPLQIACKFGRSEVAIKLIQCGANVNVLNKERMTPLHLICKNNLLNCTYNLLNKIPNIDHISKQFDFKDSHVLSVVHQLLTNGADMNCINKYGWTCLHFAAHGGYTTIVTELINKKIDINSKSNSGYSALHLAALCGYVQEENNISDDLDKIKDESKDANGDKYLFIVTELIDHNADMFCKSNNKHSPLHFAVNGGNVSIVKLLLNRGADINDKDDQGHTPIHIAVQIGHIKVLTELLKNNADINCTNDEGQTALDYAIENNKKEAIQILKSYKTHEKMKNIKIQNI